MVASNTKEQFLSEKKAYEAGIRCLKRKRKDCDNDCAKRISELIKYYEKEVAEYDRMIGRLK